MENWKDMQQRNIGYVLMGPVGTGKSFFAGCVANRLMEQGIPVMMTNFSRILNELTKPYADKNEFISHLVSYPLLIIDDLGIERNSEFALEMIYNIIDRRYCIKKPLIVTTNLSYQDMTRADLDMDHQRIYSRLMEMCLPIIYQGQDQRQQTRTPAVITEAAEFSALRNAVERENGKISGDKRGGDAAQIHRDLRPVDPGGNCCLLYTSPSPRDRG